MNTIKVDKDLEDIFPEYLDHRKDDLAQLPKLLSDKNFNKIKTIGHRLAGNAPAYGLDELGEIGIKLEKAALDEDLDEISLQVESYNSFMDSLKVEFE